MSDSEGTEPATDDFESRFMEIDELSDRVSSDSDYFPLVPSSSEKREVHPVSVFAQNLNKLTTAQQPASSSRPQRLQRKPRFSLSPDDFDTAGYDQPKTSSLVRTRIGYQVSQSSLWSLEDMTAKGQQQEPSPTPTPEQLEARNRKIVRRRESAKHKAELEKRQTVEKLLRINTEFSGGRKKKPPILPSSVTEAAGVIGLNSKNNSSADPGSITAVSDCPPTNTLYPSAPLDPPAGYVRLISSSRLTPHSMVALSATADLSVLFPSKSSSSTPDQKRCENCHLHIRRYACPITGASLCSLNCFKALSANRVASLST